MKIANLDNGNLSISLDCLADVQAQAYKSTINEETLCLEMVEAQARRMRDELNKFLGDFTESAEDPEVQRFLSPEVPEGYTTILGWVARHQGPRNADLFNAQGCDQRAGFKLMHRAHTTPVKVPACAFLQERGITEVNAYPTVYVGTVVDEYTVWEAA